MVHKSRVSSGIAVSLIICFCHQFHSILLCSNSVTGKLVVDIMCVNYGSGSHYYSIDECLLLMSQAFLDVVLSATFQEVFPICLLD